MTSSPTNNHCEFSPDRRYRYTLWREWDVQPEPMCRSCADDGPWCRTSGRYCNAGPNNYLMVIGLNPSTADETKDDPTIRRCIGFAKRWGFGKLVMTNAFAWRDTDPRKMKEQADPAGPDNDMWLCRMGMSAGLILVAWGIHGEHRGRADQVLHMLEPWKPHCLGANAGGTPKHPLYVPAKTIPVPYGG